MDMRYAIKQSQEGGAGMPLIDSDTLMKEWLGGAQAARVLGVTPQWIRALAKEGKLEAVETPLGYIYRRADVERMAQERAGSR